ncbi:hypothetical protein [Thalassobacterium sedimentorum]|uniref:hypothetical protein n=1 Tax=Thalassobacterium sedimentorum TaxID=3041258 RepID=UPI002810BEB4|nr:hypothetical protein [Coraliomargarita sp. SDUM461004]
MALRVVAASAAICVALGAVQMMAAEAATTAAIRVVLGAAQMMAAEAATTAAICVVLGAVQMMAAEARHYGFNVGGAALKNAVFLRVALADPWL